ncbi:unnamed protein product [Euphydryas editha]|uniref:DDE Tnp4 domain-containing protein n=1 Tax=Euphydryas editha TaxID=104508 RepID=A0AAU9UQL6_EUPED|nr:unnamed protein product [Euphydryas editha]
MADSSSSSSSSDIALLQQLSDWESDEDNVPGTINDLLTEIYPFLRVTSKRNHGVPPLHQLLLTLRFYSLGTMLVAVADYIGVSKSSAGRIVKDVSQAIARLYPKYIYIHNNTQEDFYKIARFPRVLGAIDCTHILMQSPNSNIGEEFRNRKSVFSLNVQGVCNANLQFMNVVARWPGSTHDATIFNNSELRAQCESGVYGNRWLLGDSAYPCKSYLLTPLLNTQCNNDVNYNRAHIRTRNTIERCFGVWKRRFPVLSLKIRLSMETTQAVVVATSVLHNICRQRNLQEVEPEIDIPNYNININSANVPESHSLNQIQERQLLINNYFR